MINDIRKELINFIFRSVDFRGRPATIGRPDGVIFPTSEGGTEYQNKIYATYTDVPEPNGVAIIDRNGISATPQMPIRVINYGGQYPIAVSQKHGPEMGTYTNNGAIYPTDSHNHYLEGPNPEYVEGLRFLPVCVHPSSPPALTVYIEPGFYRYLGTMKAWAGGTSGSLSSYVPVVDDGRIHFVIIALDRSDNSVDIIDGDDVPAGGDIFFPVNAVVTYADILAVSIDAKYMPLAVVEMQYGQTTIKVKHITHDHRLWGGEVIGFDITGLTEDTAPDVTADYLVTYDTSAGANKKVLAENMPGIKGNVGMVFSQTVDGTVANTTTPTDLLSTGVGSVTIPANTFETGVVVRVFMAGHLSTTGTPDFELSAELGALEVATTGVNTLASSLSNVGWRLWLDLVCRSFPATGSVVASGVWRLGASMYGLVNTSTTTVDPTDPLAIEVLAAWGTADAANTVTCQVATIEILSIVGL